MFEVDNELGLVIANHSCKERIRFLVMSKIGRESVLMQMQAYKRSSLKQVLKKDSPVHHVYNLNQSLIGYLMPGELAPAKLSHFLQSLKQPFSIEISLEVIHFPSVGDLIAHPLWAVMQKYDIESRV